MGNNKRIGGKGGEGANSPSPRFKVHSSDRLSATVTHWPRREFTVQLFLVVLKSFTITVLTVFMNVSWRFANKNGFITLRNVHVNGEYKLSVTVNDVAYWNVDALRDQRLQNHVCGTRVMFTFQKYPSFSKQDFRRLKNPLSHVLFYFWQEQGTVTKVWRNFRRN